MLQNSQKFRAGTRIAVPVPPVFVARAYRTPKSSGYGYECRTELTEVSGTGMNVLHNLQKFFFRVMPGVKTPGMVLYVPHRTQPWKFP